MNNNPHLPEEVEELNVDVSNPLGLGRTNRGHVDLRHWWLPDTSHEWVRTKKGITFPVGDIPDVIIALANLYNENAEPGGEDVLGVLQGGVVLVDDGFDYGE